MGERRQAQKNSKSLRLRSEFAVTLEDHGPKATPCSQRSSQLMLHKRELKYNSIATIGFVKVYRKACPPKTATSTNLVMCV